MKKVPWMLMFVLAFVSVSAPAWTQAEPGWRVLRDGKWGMIRADGNPLVEPRYDYLYAYRNGYTVAVLGDRRAYLDSRGHEITPFSFDHAYHFFNDLAWAQVGDRYALVNRQGKPVTDFDLTNPWDYGVFTAARRGAEPGLLIFDGQGRIIARAEQVSDYNVKDQLIVRQGGKYGVIDTAGQAVIPAAYTSLSRLDDEVYVGVRETGACVLSRVGQTLYQTATLRVTDYYPGYVVLVDPPRRMYGLESTAGAQVLPFEFAYLSVDATGLATGYTGDRSNRTYTLLDLATSAKTVIEGNYVQAFDQNGLSIFLARNGKYGVLDRDGRSVAEPVYDYLAPYSEGLAVAKVGGRFGYLDTSGRLAIDARFDAAYDFSEGLAVVRMGPVRGGKRGYVRKDGTFAIEPRFDWAFSFRNGVAHVAFGDYATGTFGYISPSGDYLWAPSN